MKVGIKVEPEIRTKLIKWKYTLGCKSIEEVLERMFKLISKFKLASELKDIKK